MKLTIQHNKTYVSEASKDDVFKLVKSLRIWFKDFQGNLQCVSLFKGKDQAFPTGYLETVLKKLEKRGIVPQLEDKRKYPAGHLVFTKKNNFPKLWDHQEEALVALDKEPTGIVSSLMGCHAKGTKILMFDGSLKLVESVIVGDELMGPDSEPRKVLSLCRGRETMYKVIPTKGKPFIVNGNHILSLKKTPSKNGDDHKLINLSVNNFINEVAPTVKPQYMLYKVGVDFKNTQESLAIDPYIFGLWLGDGHSDQASLTSMDSEVVTPWIEYGKSLGLDLTISEKKETDCKTYNFVLPPGGNRGKRDVTKNVFHIKLKEMDCFNNKHIPFNYKTSSRENRLQILAGLIDTDGSYDDRGCCFDFINKNKELVNDLAFICRSLGLSCNVKKCRKSCISKGKKVWGTYYRASISGDIQEVPTRIERKKARCRNQIKSHLVTSFELKKLPVDDYYGFELDKDHLYLMGDFTVTHNTGKSRLIIETFLLKRVKTLIVVPTTTIQKQLYKDFCEAVGMKYVSMKSPKDLGNDPNVRRVGSSYNDRVSDSPAGPPKKKLGSGYIEANPNEGAPFVKKKIGSTYTDYLAKEEIPEEAYLKRKKQDKQEKWNKKNLEKKYFQKPIKIKEYPVTILCFQGLDQVSQAYLNSVECVIVDECHHASAKTIRETLLRMPAAAYRYGFSATPWRDKYNEEMLLISALGNKKIFELSPEEAIERKLVARPKLEVINSPTPDFFLQKMTHWRTVLEHGIIGNQKRNKAIINRAKELVENGRNVLICVDEIAHLEILKKRFEEQKINPFIIHGQMKQSTKDENIETISFTDTGVISIATMAVGEGANLVNVDVVILAGGGKGSIRFLQRIGRGIRKTEKKDEMLVVDFEDWFNPILSKHSRIRYKMFREMFGTGKK
jgi:superfamily II DNA or RNA helicase